MTLSAEYLFWNEWLPSLLTIMFCISVPAIILFIIVFKRRLKTNATNNKRCSTGL